MESSRKSFSLMCLGAAISLVGCTNAHLRLEGVVEVEGGREGRVTLDSTYDTTGHAVACAVTAILYGGWCWAYLAMPFSGQREEVREDANDLLRRRLVNSDFELVDVKVERVGWSNVRRSFDLRLRDDPPQASEASRPERTERRERRLDPYEHDERPLRSSNGSGWIAGGVAALVIGALALGVSAENTDRECRDTHTGKEDRDQCYSERRMPLTMITFAGIGAIVYGISL